MDETRVACFLRNDAAVLLCRSEGGTRGAWGAVTDPAGDDPDAAAREAARERTGLGGELSLRRRGDPFEVGDRSHGRQVVHPYLFDCPVRAVGMDREAADHAWVAPTAILHRGAVTGLWRAYDRVRPRVEAIADDREHGAADLSVRALAVLRDEAAVYGAGNGSRNRTQEDGDGWSEFGDLAVALREARPSMPVVANRVNRVMAAASRYRSVPAVEHAASAGIDEALGADERAAARAAERVAGARVATLSRSGTVSTALSRADPEAVLVAESRPGGEGRDVAAALAGGTDVTLTTDAALAHAVDEWGADAVLVGADAVRPDGAVVNKAGTRAAALAGTYEGIEVLVVAATDKVAPDGRTDLEHRDPAEVYDGEDVSVYNPTFDVTPADCIDAVVTEAGTLERGGVTAVAADHRERAGWSEE